jgi:hypothetical protein
LSGFSVVSPVVGLLETSVVDAMVVTFRTAVRCSAVRRVQREI